MTDFGVGARQLLTETEKQLVLDAAAALQVRRSDVAAALSRGPFPDAEIVSSGGTLAELNRGLFGHSTSWRELHSVRTGANVALLRLSLPNNRRILDDGLRMQSIFDARGVDLGSLLLLANEPVGNYLISFAPVQMKIVDRREVLLQGPSLPSGEETVMSVRSTTCLDAAWHYWEAVRAHAVPAGEGVGALTELTPRQRQVVALMSTGLGDDGIAQTLAVSVRTVRTDIAALLDLLGVRTRFAAGVRLQFWPDIDAE